MLRKRTFFESSKENELPAKKKTMDMAFSFSQPKDNSLRKKVIQKQGARTILGSCENKISNSKRQQSIKKYYPGVNGKGSNKIQVFDENKQKTEQKEGESNAFQLLCSKEAPEKYWQMLAEERRKALEYALEENKQLAEEINIKDKTITDLEEEVEELKETASHAEYLASVIEGLGKECGIELDNDTEPTYSEESENDESSSYSVESALKELEEKNLPENEKTVIEDVVKSTVSELLSKVELILTN